jgi:hypothetical protein
MDLAQTLVLRYLVSFSVKSTSFFFDFLFVFSKINVLARRTQIHVSSSSLLVNISRSPMELVSWSVFVAQIIDPAFDGLLSSALGSVELEVRLEWW